MKKINKKVKYILYFFISLIFFIGFLFLFDFDKNAGNIKGEITVWSDENSYDYLNAIAQNFMISNNKCKVNVIKVNKDEYYSMLESSINSGSAPNVINLDNKLVSELVVGYEKIVVKDNEEFINSYSNNFTPRMIQEVIYDDKVVGVPFITKPIVLYLREDLLKTYGYSYKDIKTWSELVDMGKYIYNKSQGQIKVLNGVGDDYNYLVSLLTMQAMEETTNEISIKKEVEEKLSLLRGENILNIDPNGSYLARISSIEAMNELRKIDIECTWTANNAPSNVYGGNRFYVVEDENLVLINSDSYNENLLSEKYVAAVTTNSEDIYSYISNNNIFLSYLYAYKNKEIENGITNFQDKSPLVTMSNILEKAPSLKDFNKYTKIKNELIN